MKAQKRATGIAAATLAGALTVAVSANAHHSFSIYDSSVTKVFTGVVTRVNPDANHLQIFFAPMNEERNGVVRDEKGEPVVWAVEMAGSAQSARQGISVSSFPRGTFFSVALHPLRSGEPAGSREGGFAMFKCPEGVRPEAGKHCDSVEGHTKFGEGELPSATE